MNSNPYSPPAAYTATRRITYAYESPFAPLGTRMVLASMAVVFASVASLTLDIAMLAYGDRMTGDDPDLTSSLLLGGAGLLTVLASILAAIFFCVWLHRAAKNLPALGRTGMTYTPGWTIGWFFVPFANLVRPLATVTEVWKASDPTIDPREGYGWLGSRGSGLLPLWWGAWILSSILANISGRIDASSSSGAVGLAGTMFSMVAAVLCILVMREITSRQEQVQRVRVSQPTPMHHEYR